MAFERKGTGAARICCSTSVVDSGFMLTLLLTLLVACEKWDNWLTSGQSATHPPKHPPPTRRPCTL